MLTTRNEERALSLLGKGVSPAQVASAIGVSASRISQLLSQEEFSDKVSALRYESLAEKSGRDAGYDKLEDKLLGKLEKSLPLMIKPAEILNALKVTNAAKRRGSPDVAVGEETAPIVNLVLPVHVAQKFTMNIDNQIISAGEGENKQNLVTMQSGTLLKIGEDRTEEKKEERGRMLEEKKEQTLIKERVGVLLDEKTKERDLLLEHNL